MVGRCNGRTISNVLRMRIFCIDFYMSNWHCNWTSNSSWLWFWLDYENIKYINSKSWFHKSHAFLFAHNKILKKTLYPISGWWCPWYSRPRTCQSFKEMMTLSRPWTRGKASAGARDTSHLPAVVYLHPQEQGIGTVGYVAPRMRTVDWSGLSRDAVETRAWTIKCMEKNQRETTKEKWRLPVWIIQETCGFWRQRKGSVFVSRTAVGKEMVLWQQVRQD